jgi:hypothetical protein
MFAARADLYRAFDSLIAFFIQSNYRVDANGKLIFADQSALDRFNAAANALNVATTKVNQIGAEGKEISFSKRDGNVSLAER